MISVGECRGEGGSDEVEVLEAREEDGMLRHAASGIRGVQSDALVKSMPEPQVSKGQKARKPEGQDCSLLGRHRI